MEIFSSLECFSWASLKMEATLVIFAVVTLLATVMLPKNFNRFISIIAFLGMYIALAINFVYPYNINELSQNQGCIVPTDILALKDILPPNNVYGCLIVICAILSSQMSFHFFNKLGKDEYRNEFISLIMICASALIVFGRSENLMLSFVALETATICLYILASFNKDCSSSLEAGVKYLIIGGVSGAILLLGLAFIYGAGKLAGVDFMYFGNFSVGLLNNFFLIGFILVLTGIFFKLAAFPFQFWAPDVYQGAPTAVSALFAVASKIAGVVFLAKIFVCLKFDSAELVVVRDNILFGVSVIAGMTIIIGNFGGITQLRTKRLMAFSGISNAGYLLVLLVAVLAQPKNLETFDSVLYFYLGAYLFANYALFFAINQFNGSDESLQSMQDYRGLMRRNPVVASSLTICLASLAGIPPTAGFFGKVLILILAWYAELYTLIAIMILGSAVSIYYYFAWIRAMLEKAEGKETEFVLSTSSRQTIIMLSIAVIIVSFAVFPLIGI